MSTSLSIASIIEKNRISSEVPWLILLDIAVVDPATLMTVETLGVPIADGGDRLEVAPLGYNFFRVVVRFGFAEDPDIPAAIAACTVDGRQFDMMDTTFFVSRETVVATDRPGMALWRDRLFAFLARNASSATAFFRLPGNRLVELGTQVEI